MRAFSGDSNMPAVFLIEPNGAASLRTWGDAPRAARYSCRRLRSLRRGVLLGYREAGSQSGWCVTALSRDAPNV